jgi:hypothetical protein
MKNHDAGRHPGPMRVMPVDAEFAGVLIAIAFVVLAVVGLPIAKWLLLETVLVGGAVALLFRFLRRH